MSSNKTLLAFIGVLALFAIAAILKWTYRLVFGLLDYGLIIGIVFGVVWYSRLPAVRKRQLQTKVKAKLKSIGQRFGIN